MLNQTNYTRLNLDQFVVGDSVLIKLRNHAKGWEYFGIVEGMDEKHFHILGKPLAWVLAGDLRLQKYSFYKAVINEVKFYTREDAKDARERADEIYMIENPCDIRGCKIEGGGHLIGRAGKIEGGGA